MLSPFIRFLAVALGVALLGFAPAFRCLVFELEDFHFACAGFSVPSCSPVPLEAPSKLKLMIF